jgi:hypothetical protein
MSNATRTEIKKSKIEVSRIFVSDFQKQGSETCELKQTVKTVSFYPSKSVKSNLSDNLFEAEDFGYEEQEFVQERTDVAWIIVPKGTTIDTVKSMLDKVPNATLYRIISNHPILTDNQKYSISQGLKTMDDYANAQVMRYGTTTDEHNEGDLVLDSNGKPQYKACFFSKEPKADIDLRTSDPQDFYASVSIYAEMNMETVSSQVL